MSNSMDFGRFSLRRAFLFACGGTVLRKAPRGALDSAAAHAYNEKEFSARLRGRLPEGEMTR